MEYKTHYIEAHIIRRNDNDELENLLLLRSDKESYPGIWQPVTGTIAKDEKAYQTAIREINEETGINPKNLWVVPMVNAFYNWEKEIISFVPVFVAEVDYFSEIKLSPEHTEYIWVKKEDAKKMVSIKNHKNSIDLIDEYFSNYKSTLLFSEIKLQGE